MRTAKRGSQIYSLLVKYSTQNTSWVAERLKGMPSKIHQQLSSGDKELEECSKYLFDGRGKAIRPTITLLMAGACSYHCAGSCKISPAQETLAMVTEMIHTASMAHDDVIDQASIRRGKPAMSEIWDRKKTILAGDFILSRGSMALAQIRNTRVVELLSTVIDNLVHGELMQLESCRDEQGRFNHYLQKTFMKTASLMAYSCQAAATLASEDDDDLHQIAYHYGENVGMAFQLIDDLLDFKSTSKDTGKPTAVDLRLGLATAPVLFAAKQYPELNELIDRHFTRTGDVEMAQDIVHRSDGLTLTHQLADEHCSKAVDYIQKITTSPEQLELIKITQDILHRNK
ncbi:all trans-polyprenyl-diphosphate synthase PDSS1-like [Dysidea avara]|uniref:all trans-polyprenyl-diphosphate synthase PDSS1-like n=1 Tax=Dysidea avara TaxID=196820 RepID=UPI003327F7BB